MTESHNGDGSSFDDFLRDEGMHEEVTSAAAARVLAWQNGLAIAAFHPKTTDPTQETPTDD